MIFSFDEYIMKRCLHLASLAKNVVAPNPMVGAVLVFGTQIIGEGYHKQYGGAHAEVNCINSVAEVNKQYIEKSTLYVSLEPCSHFGKTPPCVDLIIQYKIPRVVIGCKDIFKRVNGNGIERLQNAGIETVEGVLEKDCIALNKRFFNFHQYNKPYVVLKWAESEDKKIAGNKSQKIFISNAITNRGVHQWRSEETAILIGTNTAIIDNPQLNNRYTNGRPPIRLVIDKSLRINTAAHLFNQQQPTVIFNHVHLKKSNQITWVKLNKEQNLLPQILHWCFENSIQSILVEGGAVLLQSFIDEGLWNEMRIITAHNKTIGHGISSPKPNNKLLIKKEQYVGDTICYYLNL